MGIVNQNIEHRLKTNLKRLRSNEHISWHYSIGGKKLRRLLFNRPNTKWNLSAFY